MTLGKGRFRPTGKLTALLKNQSLPGAELAIDPGLLHSSSLLNVPQLLELAK